MRKCACDEFSTRRECAIGQLNNIMYVPDESD